MGPADAIPLGDLRLSGVAAGGGWGTSGISDAPCGQLHCMVSAASGIQEPLTYHMLGVDFRASCVGPLPLLYCLCFFILRVP